MYVYVYILYICMSIHIYVHKYIHTQLSLSLSVSLVGSPVLLVLDYFRISLLQGVTGNARQRVIT